MHRKLKLALAGFVIAAGWILFSPLLATHLIVERPLGKADAMIVLSGSAVYKERMRKAAELYQQGVAGRIFITDDGGRAGWLDNEKANVPFVELELRELISNGVPSEAIIVLPGTVSGTDDEAKAAAVELDARPLDSLLIVTSAYHSRRALKTFDSILSGRAIVGIVSPPPGIRTPKPEFWWLSPRGWQTVAGEYVKSAVYYAYY